MSANTVRRVIQGKEVDHSTIEKLAGHLHLPTDEVYRMAGILPAREIDGNPNRDWLLSKLFDVLSRLPESDQAAIFAEALRTIEQRESSENSQ
jgi:hypothetical protein